MSGIWASLPGDMDALVFGVLLATSFGASFITVALGIGGGALLLAIMASLVPPAALIPVHGVIQLGSNAGRVAILFNHIFWQALPAFVAGSILGSVLGGLVVVELSPAAVQIGVGAFVIWTVISRPPAWLRRWPAVTGAVSSFLTMFFGATGLFVASFTKSLTLPRHSHVATHGALMTIQHMLKVFVFGFLGFAFAEWAAFILAMILSGGAGTIAGRQLLNRMNDAGFKTALNIVLVLISLRLIWAGLQSAAS